MKMMKLTFWFILVSIGVRGTSADIKGDESSECSCGVFPSDSPDPILEQTFQFKVPCSNDGANKCQQICTVLAQAAENKAPDMICDKLKIHVEKLRVTLGMKICDLPWKQIDLNIPSVCCHNGKSIPCNFQE
ncbi:uncharacterized protein [Fopius arisanus]|uniref:Uncharacterized protein n=1 Tax=Fopius arisanus TaxID=64838 RepID=A0A9R1T1V5_9HYME|nr:PREDICTED: uncharacterized protein LOC105265419 [Fopius arisanus]XP_011301192.1 PREDICTED: uncharacterized protein LOC105265419 [Fopius arisanus]